MDPKSKAREKIDSIHGNLLDLSHKIHANPELGFNEVKACAWLTAMLAGAGFAVETGVCDLPTAFIARVGSGPLHIAICAEYDSLPGIGHACGHNMIAAMAVGAGIAAGQVADEVGMSISVIGTPAEEGGGGKILMLERGAFKDVHAAMMVHPSGLPHDVINPRMNAAAHLEVHYTGKEAHAGSSPELGINAADALTVAQVAIGLLRQHIRPTDRVHGIVTKGGDAPNIVPASTSARYLYRAQTLQELEELRPKIYRCFEAGAVATGSKLKLEEPSSPYAQVNQDQDIAALYRKNAEAQGRIFGEPNRGGGSTDMGNVSLALPSIHPMIGLGSFPVVNHQPEFAAVCATEIADRAVIQGGLTMAWTAIDMAQDPHLRDRLLAGTKP